MVEEPVIVVGCGPGTLEWIPPIARRTAEEAHVIAGVRRLLDLFPEAKGERIVLEGSMDGFLDKLAAHVYAGEKVVVLASGDVGLFSIARTLERKFGRKQCRRIPGISSMQVACAALDIDWHNAVILDAHGTVPDTPVEELIGADKLIVFLDKGVGWEWLVETATYLRDSHDIHLCENLGILGENIRRVPVDSLKEMKPPRLALAVLLWKGWHGD